MQYAIELHYLDGTIDIESVKACTRSQAEERAKRILATYARAQARGDIDDADVPWVWLISMTQNSTATMI